MEFTFKNKIVEFNIFSYRYHNFSQVLWKFQKINEKLAFVAIEKLKIECTEIVIRVCHHNVYFLP